MLFHFEDILLPWGLKMISDSEPLQNYPLKIAVSGHLSWREFEPIEVIYYDIWKIVSQLMCHNKIWIEIDDFRGERFPFMIHVFWNKFLSRTFMPDWSQPVDPTVYWSTSPLVLQTNVHIAYQLIIKLENVWNKLRLHIKY